MLDVNITADASWADAAIVGMTILIFFAAVGAAVQVNRQIRQAERHHSEQLHLSLRPVLAIPHAESRLNPQSGLPEFKVWIQNVGPGPAMNPVISAWVRIPEHGWEAPAERSAEIDSLKSQIDVDEPELTARAAAIVRESPTRPAILIPNRAIPVANYADRKGIIIYNVALQDIFENRLPSKPKDERELGHIEISEQGSWPD
ncbi:MAG: hypothetical protein IIA90_00505 [Chloroflexi bacterium]|nr:hypothetical protein [Chloroflexota bacterium]